MLHIQVTRAVLDKAEMSVSVGHLLSNTCMHYRSYKPAVIHYYSLHWLYFLSSVIRKDK